MNVSYRIILKNGAWKKQELFCLHYHFFMSTLTFKSYMQNFLMLITDFWNGDRAEWVETSFNLLSKFAGFWILRFSKWDCWRKWNCLMHTSLNPSLFHSQVYSVSLQEGNQVLSPYSLPILIRTKVSKSQIRADFRQWLKCNGKC